MSHTKRLKDAFVRCAYAKKYTPKKTNHNC